MLNQGESSRKKFPEGLDDIKLQHSEKRPVIDRDINNLIPNLHAICFTITFPYFLKDGIPGGLNTPMGRSLLRSKAPLTKEDMDTYGRRGLRYCGLTKTTKENVVFTKREKRIYDKDIKTDHGAEMNAFQLEGILYQMTQ